MARKYTSYIARVNIKLRWKHLSLSTPTILIFAIVPEALYDSPETVSKLFSWTAQRLKLVYT